MQLKRAISFILIIVVFFCSIENIYADDSKLSGIKSITTIDGVSSGNSIEIDEIESTTDTTNLLSFDNEMSLSKRLYGNTNYNIINGGKFVLNEDTLFYSYQGEIIKEDENSSDVIITEEASFLNIFDQRLYYVSKDKIFSTNFSGGDKVEEFCSDGIFINNFIVYNNTLYFLLGNDIYYVNQGHVNKVDLGLEVHNFAVANDDKIFATVFSDNKSYDYLSDSLIEYSISNNRYSIICENVGYYDSNSDCTIYSDLDDNTIYKYVLSEKGIYPLVSQANVSGVNISESIKIYVENQPYVYDENDGLVPTEPTPYDDIGISLYSIQGNNIVNVAAAEVGNSGRPNKYTYWYGTISGSYSYEWCQTFASWCANQAGLSSYYPKTASCDVGKDWFINHEIAHYEVSQAFGGTYEPQPGDFIYFSDGHTQADSTHVGIVEKVDSNNVYTIEGNYSNSVRKVTRQKNNNGYIIGYGVPEFNLVKGNNPKGSVDSITGGTGCVKVRGWAFDPDDKSKALSIHVYIGGPAGEGTGYPITANVSRADVNNVYGCGTNHGFDATIPTNIKGNQQIYIYAINIGSGETELIGNELVNIGTDTTSPTISDVKISNKSKDGYTVSCTVKDNSAIDSVVFFTRYGNEDWKSSTAKSVSGNTYSYDVRVSDYSNREGNYITHIHSLDISGNLSVDVCPTQYIDRTSPTVSNVKVAKTITGYTVSCKATDSSGINRVQFPTWSSVNDQDDIQSSWTTNTKASGTKNGDTYTYTVKYSEHNNDQGKYNTHIYAYDNYGNLACIPVDVGYYYKYTVAYNANGGTGAPASQTKVTDVNLTLSGTKPTRTGYTFQGWATSASATKASYSAGGSYTANSAVTLYAVWKINTYTISYNGNGGSNVPENQIKEYNKDIQLSDIIPIRNGYRFVCWVAICEDVSVTYYPGDTFSENMDTKFTAVWTKVKTGDVNNDNNVDELDSALVLKHIANIQNLDGNKHNIDAAECDGDGIITITDVIWILNHKS